MTIVVPSCLTCRHFHRDDQRRETCDAFPDGIPAPILRAEHDHHTPFRGDHGIQFEPLPDAAENSDETGE